MAKLVLAGTSLGVHLIPFLIYSKHPLGYDTGFYRRYLIQPFSSFPNTPVPGLGDDAFVLRAVLDLLRATGLPPDIVLYGLYLACFALVPVLLYVLLVKHLGRRGALIAGLLVVFSAVAYNAYWYMLLKNAWALCLLLAALICFERRWMPSLFLLDIAIAGSHKTTAIIYVVMLGILFVLSKERRRELFLHGALAGSVLLALNLPSIREALVVLPSAAFLDWTSYLTLSVPLLLLLLCAGFAFRHVEPPRTLIAFTLASFLFPIFRLPFYERIFVFSDVALAGLVAYGAEYLLARAKQGKSVGTRYTAIAVLCVAVGFLFGNLWNQVVTLRPLVSEADIAEISRIELLMPSDATVLTTSDEAPWFEGWTSVHVAAPGLLHDTHNLEAWLHIWNDASEEERISFLASFPAPLYVSTLGPLENLLGTPPLCLSQVTPHLFYSSCQKP